MATSKNTTVRPLLTLTGISKNFGGVQALRGVDFDVRAGEVHALVGENGAGKSTMMKIIAGNHMPSAGTIHLEGEEMRFRNPHDALVRGIALIHQETALAPDLTVAENVMICHLPGLIRWGDLYRRAAQLIKSLGFDIDPAAPVSSLSTAHRQIVEIAKALSLNVKMLVLDEPTASLAPSDASRLLEILRDLRERGVAMVYISHRLHEVFDIADRITVLKDGEKVSTVTPTEVDMDGLIRLMVGRPLAALFPKREGVVIGNVLLKVDALTRKGVVDNVSLAVRAGEVVGLGGLIGSGRTELVRMIFGADRPSSGTVSIDGHSVTPKSTGAGVAAGIGLVPEDRKAQGAVLTMPIRVNSTMARLSDVSGFGFLRLARERQTVAQLMKRLQIKARDMDADVSTLSGGNQQKVVLAKWFHAHGRVIILDEPTRGVDVGAKAEIYTLINTLAAQGMAIVVVSSEHAELMGLCDRILVMGGGRLCGQLDPPDYSEEAIVAMSLGHSKADASFNAAAAA
jgi:ribose transport system ATP-binding protein